MARAIPTYQRQNLAQGIQSAPNASSNVSASDPMAAAIGNLAQVAGAASNTLADEATRNANDLRQQTEKAALEAKRSAENAAAVDVANVLSQGDPYWQEYSAKRMQAWKVGDPDMRTTIGTDFDKWVAESTAKLPTDASKKYFQQHAASMKARLQTNAFTFQEKSTTAKLNADSDAGQQADENTVYNDPTRFDEVFKRRVDPLLARSDLSEADKIKAADLYKRKLSLAVERGEMQRDPVGWYASRFGPAAPVAGVAGAGAPAAGAGFAAVMPRIFAVEGGYSASDGNTGKPVNFGINQGANPDVDVKNLTKEGAAKIYKERYWDKIKGDTLPPALQGTAMDAAVNQGPANAQKWIEASGGDPVKFNELRRAHYEMLLQDPANRKFSKTWMNRLAAYEREAGNPTPASGASVGRTAPLDTAPATFRSMDWEQQDAMRSMVETRIKQGEAVYKAQVDSVIREAIAMHKDGIQDPQPIPVETFDRAYGAEGPRMYAEYQKSRLMGADISGFKTQSEAEIMATLDRLQPVPGPGYAADDERQRVRVQAAQAELKKRNDDPAGYATRNSESLKGQQAALAVPTLSGDERARLMQKFTSENLAEQQRLGIAIPQVLTPRQADAIAMRAMNATKPEDSANLIGGLQAEYGEFFPRVFDQLVKEGKIAGELLIIPNLPSQTAREAVSRMARIKEADLTQGIDPAGQKAVKEAVTATLSEFSKTIPLMTSQAAGVVNAYETTLRKLAYQFMQGGTKPSEAAEQARTMLLGQYTFVDTMRIPKPVNPSQAMKGAERMLATDLTGIDVPRDVTGARNPAEAAAEWQATVKARPQWFTKQDDGGIELWAMGNNGTRYRVIRGGQSVAYTWEQLTTAQARAMAAPPTTSQEALMRGDMRAYDRLRTAEKNAQRKLEMQPVTRSPAAPAAPAAPAVSGSVPDFIQNAPLPPPPAARAPAAPVAARAPAVAPPAAAPAAPTAPVAAAPAPASKLHPVGTTVDIDWSDTKYRNVGKLTKSKDGKWRSKSGAVAVDPNIIAKAESAAAE
jgi:hypothetical protein